MKDGLVAFSISQCTRKYDFCIFSKIHGHAKCAGLLLQSLGCVTVGSGVWLLEGAEDQPAQERDRLSRFAFCSLLMDNFSITPASVWDS